MSMERTIENEERFYCLGESFYCASKSRSSLEHTLAILRGRYPKITFLLKGFGVKKNGDGSFIKVDGFSIWFSPPVELHP